MSEKRYVQTIEVWVWAEDDKEAITKSRENLEKINKIIEGDATTQELGFHPFGSIFYREIEIR